MLKDSVLLITSLRSSTCPLPAFIYAIPSPPTINSLILIRHTYKHTHMAHTQSDCLLIRTGSKNLISQGKWTHKTQLASANKCCQSFSHNKLHFRDYFLYQLVVFSGSMESVPLKCLLPFKSHVRIVTYEGFGTVFVGTPSFSCSFRAISRVTWHLQLWWLAQNNLAA